MSAVKRKAVKTRGTTTVKARLIKRLVAINKRLALVEISLHLVQGEIGNEMKKGTKRNKTK